MGQSKTHFLMCLL